MSYCESNTQVILTDAAIQPMAEVLIYRLTQLPLSLTDRQKRLGQALFRFIAGHKPQLLLAGAEPRAQEEER